MAASQRSVLVLQMESTQNAWGKALWFLELRCTMRIEGEVPMMTVKKLTQTRHWAACGRLGWLRCSHGQGS